MAQHPQEVGEQIRERVHRTDGILAQRLQAFADHCAVVVGPSRYDRKMDQTGALGPLRDAAQLREVFSLVLDRADPDARGLEYRLTGTGAALAQGVELQAGDIDVLVARRGDVNEFAAALSGFPCLTAPVWLPECHQYFAEFKVEEIGVSFSTVEQPTDSDAFEGIGRGPWEHYVAISFGRHVVPAVSLELRLGSELVRDRPDRYEPLIEHLRLHGADLDLVRRVLIDREVDGMLRQQILDRLDPLATTSEVPA